MSAPALRGTGFGTVVTGTGTPISMPPPAGVQTGDLLIGCVSLQGGSGTWGSYTRLGAAVPYSPGGGLMLDVAWLIAPSASPGNAAYTWAGGAPSMAGVMLAVQAGTFDPATPIDKLAVGWAPPPDGGGAGASVTPSGADRLHIGFAAERGATANCVSSWSGGGLTWTELFDVVSSAGSPDVSIAAATAPNPGSAATYLYAAETGVQGLGLVHFAVNPVAAPAGNPIAMIL